MFKMGIFKHNHLVQTKVQDCTRLSVHAKHAVRAPNKCSLLLPHMLGVMIMFEMGIFKRSRFVQTRALMKQVEPPLERHMWLSTIFLNRHSANFAGHS
jgi:hypothetical protein